MKIKMLVWSDYCTSTGFANVMSNILRRLDLPQYEIDVVGVNYSGDPDYDHERFPGNVFPAVNPQIKQYSDMAGRQRVIDMARDKDYDIIFMLQDSFVAEKVIPVLNEVKEKYNKNFKTVYYFPIDAPPWKRWITNTVWSVDIPIAYTKYGAECAKAADDLSRDVRVIPHGIDLNDFFYIGEREDVNQYRQWHFPATVGKTLLLNVNRNQPRKDIPRSLMVLSELKNRRDDICMLLHMSNHDIGGDLTPVANQLGLVENVDYFMAPDLDNMKDGYPVSLLNIIYNISDILITTTLGEGWGLSLTEAMATKTPIVAPNIPPISEILGDGSRGVLVEAGNNPSFWTVINSDNMVLRPLTNVEDMADQICGIIDTEYLDDYLDDPVAMAYNWVQSLSWDNIVDIYWKELLSV